MVDAPEPLAEPAPGSGQDRASGQASRARPAAARSCLTASAKAPGAGTGAEEQPRECGVARPVARPRQGRERTPHMGPRGKRPYLPPPCAVTTVCACLCAGVGANARKVPPFPAETRGPRQAQSAGPGQTDSWMRPSSNAPNGPAPLS